MTPTNRALDAYAEVDLQTAVSTASPVQLVVLLYEGAIKAIAAAKGRMQEQKWAEKGALLSKAIDIVEGLRTVLDRERGGEIARNLDDLYDYMKRRIAAANLKNEVAALDEVIRLLDTLREAWVELEAQERQRRAAAVAAGKPAASAATGMSLRA
jgi:flagellar protein FliS